MSYFLLYNYYVEANYVYISKDVEQKLALKYMNLIYWINIDQSLLSARPIARKDVFDLKDPYSTINHKFTIYIDKLGIKEWMFILDYVQSQEEYSQIKKKKSDGDLVDLEVVNPLDIRHGFLVGGHSSWYLSDPSPLKNIFNSLQYLEIGDQVVLTRDDWVQIVYRIKNRTIKLPTDTISRSGFYMFTCYPTGANGHRLVLELEETKS